MIEEQLLLNLRTLTIMYQRSSEVTLISLSPFAVGLLNCSLVTISDALTSQVGVQFLHCAGVKFELLQLPCRQGGSSVKPRSDQGPRMPMPGTYIYATL